MENRKGNAADPKSGGGQKKQVPAGRELDEGDLEFIVGGVSHPDVRFCENCGPPVVAAQGFEYCRDCITKNQR